MEKNIEALQRLIETLVEFSVAYGFQLLGALVFFFIGLKGAAWTGRKVASIAGAKDVDPALARLIGNIVKLIVVAMLVVITLGNFGISIAPLIALAGAGAFGATLAIQGPLSNFGAGFAILLGRTYSVGDTITIGKVSGVVADVKLAATVLTGEDGEKITIPNKEIVGQVVVNSDDKRIVESRIAIADSEDIDQVIGLLQSVLEGNATVDTTQTPQIGVHDFTLGGVIIGLRFWVPTNHYFQTRYALNTAFLKALKAADVPLLSGAVAVAAPDLTADNEAQQSITPTSAN
ncbi:MAG: mechanosensitive ion channel family protein [Rhodospirillaceae bacterium]|nr:mechanosensitive ion channel family protein [Rhodospirillaceae bacterium]MBT7954037.1 mechanosensitive ion channel family protein [Rhodospirillaceae bacterium]